MSTFRDADSDGFDYRINPRPARRIQRADKSLDKQIEAIFYAYAAGVQVSILDISKIFEAGRKAAREDDNVEVAVRRAIDQFKVVR